MKNIALLVLAMFIISCNKNNEKADAYGNFETTEITVSSESNGKIEFLNLEEGDVVEKGKTVGLIDTLQLYYTSKKELAYCKNTHYIKVCKYTTNTTCAFASILKSSYFN